MKNYCVLLIIFLLATAKTIAQSNSIDSLKRELNKASSNEVRFGIYNALGDFFSPFIQTDSAMYYYERADEIARRNDQSLLHALCVTKIALCTMFTQSVINTYDSIQKGFDLIQDPDVLKSKYLGVNKVAADTLKLSVLGWLNWIWAHFHRDKLSNITESISYFHQGQKLALEAKDSLLWNFCNGSVMYAFLEKNMPDSALAHGQALEQNSTYSITNDIFPYVKARPEIYAFYVKDIGIAYLKLNNKPAFLNYLWRSIHFANKQEDISASFSSYLSMTEFYLSDNNKDSSFYYAKKAQQCFPDELQVYENLYKCYELKNKSDSAAKYMKLTLARLKEIRRSQLEDSKIVQQASFQKELQLQALEKEKIKNEAKWKTISIAALIGVFSVIGFLLYRNSSRERKARAIIEQSYSRLKETQAKLIQSEKMASLGQLTAGIAHEIQNPLNFVNNFSETNKELLSEMKEAIEQKNYAEAVTIAEDIENNEAKINHHGKRADAIVKSMLEHSRKNAGEKQLTDLNALADEYLRLSYQAMRSKDKNFQSAIETQFDNNLHKANVVPQDIGRVMLNLFQNAFYAVSEKMRRSNAQFEPVLSVSTKQKDGDVVIVVKDNGTGIPQKNIDKIFQPFFTTKPSGEGTGLGLSLSYDIIKAHGGEINVKTKEGEGTAFIIQLPIHS